jgi:hypothetical protein
MPGPLYRAWQEFYTPETESSRRRVALVSNSTLMSKETQKALGIILGALAFGAILLVWANHIRPHP